MAVTTQMRTQITQLYVALFGRAPEADGLGYWVQQLDAGRSFQAIAQDMYNVAPSRAYYPLSLTNQEIVAKFYENVLGRTADADGLAYWTGRLNTESTTGTAASREIAKGTVIAEMLTAVVNYNGTDATALASQSLFNNKVAVGLHYGFTLNGNDVAVASTLMPLVTAGATGTAAALASLDVNTARTLTNGIDKITANVFNSEPLYTPGGNDFINSLQDEDVLTGTGLNPTLNATLGSVNDSAESVITPKLNGIQTANFDITGNTKGVNFQDSTGLQTLNINRITQTNASITMTDLDKSTKTLSVSNATRDGDVSFLYKEDNLLGTDDAVTLNLSNTRLTSLTIDETGDSGEDKGYGFETVNINVNKSSNIDALTIGANQREDVSAANASQTLNIVANATTEINLLTASGAETINLTANADVMIAADERNVLTGANNGITTGELTKLTITGAGNVTIDGLEGNIDEKVALSGEKGTTLVVDGSTMTGALHLGVAVAADGNSSGVWANHADKDVSITSGSGDDIIETYTALAGDISTGAGNDQVLINNGASKAVYTNVEGVSTINTGAGNDTVRAANLMATAADAADGNTSFGQVTAASIITGEGDDTVSVLALQSAIDTDNGSLQDSNVDDTYFVKGASIDTGAGNDTVSFTTVAEGASISTGAGNDTINSEMVGGTILAADDTSKAEVNLDKSANELGAIVDLGDGDDIANFSQSDTSGGAVATTIVGKDAELRAGAGNDVLNVSALDAVTVNVNTSWAAKADDTNANILGVETANFTVLNQINAATEAATGFSENDDNEADGSITADVLRFDSALKAINLISEENTLLQTAATEIYNAGTATTFTLNNLREDIALTLKANEATGVDGDGALKDDQIVDVNLNINMASARGAADTFTLNIAEGSGAFDLNLNTGATLTDKIGADASKTDDDDMRLENIVVKLAADDKGHYINFNGFGDAQHTEAPEEGSKTVVTSVTVDGGVAGTMLVLDNISADTVTAAGAADVKLKLNGSNNFTITTGSGNDVINMMSDDVRANDITDDPADDNSTDATDEADAVNAGAGNDRIIINGSDNLGIYTGIAQRTDDDVFNKIKSVENIEIQGGGTNVVILDEAAATTGANLQNIYLTGTGAQTTTIQIGENFVNDSGTVKNTLTIDATKDLSKDFGAAAKDGALTLNIENQDTDQDIDLVNLNVLVGMEKGTDINFQNTGDAAAVVTITATVARNVANTVGSSLAAVPGNLSLDITTGSIDKVVLLDSANNTKLGDNPDNGNITVNVNDNWSKSSIEFDASAIKNNDAGAGADGGALVEELEGTTGQAQVAGIQGRDTGGLTFNGATELDAKLTVKGTQNDDNITGGNQADTLFGNDGDDIINGGLGDDTIDGGNGNDSLIGGIGADTISGGAGDDTINGGVGADVLTGGAGKDTYIYASVVESNGDGADLINDFVTAEDKIQLNGVVNGTAAGDFINLSSFATVATAGDGDNSLLGTTAAPVMGDAYYATDSKQLVIDVDGNGDITTAADLVIKSTSPINASDINFTINAGAGDDFIRGGQGADSLSGDAGDDTFVVVGSLSSADVAGYSASYASGGGNNSTAVLGATLVAQESKLLRATELLSTRSTTEVSKGDVYDGGAGANDTMHVFGTANFIGATLSNIETLVIHSTVTMTLAQLYSFGAVRFEGNMPHALTITKNDGSALTAAEQMTALASVPSVVVVDGTVSIGGGAAMNNAAFVTALGAAAAALPATPSAADLANVDDSGSFNTDNITNQTSALTLSGTAVLASGQSVVVFNDADNDGVQDASEATMYTSAVTGAWSFDAALAQGVHNIRSYVVDANGVRSPLASNLQITVDTTAPVAAAFNTVAGDDVINAAESIATVNVTGTNEAGATTTLNGFAVTQTSATTWTYNLSTAAITAFLEGSEVLTAVSTDLAGNATTSMHTINVDTVAPAAATMAMVATDDIINIVEHAAGVTVTGTNEAGATTTLSATGMTNVAVTQTSATTWTYTLSSAQIAAFADGAETLTMTTTDAAGNPTVSTRAITVDMTPPTAATFDVVATDDVINIAEAAALTITGTNEAGATVTVNGNAATVTGTTWSYTVNPVDVAAFGQGAETLTAVTTDVAGNSTTSTHAVSVDTIAPIAASMLPVALDDMINIAEAAVNQVVYGTNEAGATTTVNGNPVTVLTATTWSYTFTPADITMLGDGVHALTMVTTDAAGNPTTSTRSITIDTVVPAVAAPAVVATDDIINIAEAAATVTVTGTNELNATTTLSATGIVNAAVTQDTATTWSYVLSSAQIAAFGQGAEVLNFTTTDLAGNTAASTRNISVDTVAPTIQAFVAEDNVGTVTGVLTTGGTSDDLNLDLSGTGENGSTISVYDGATLVGTQVVASGVWTLNVPVVNGTTHTFTTTETDIAGNVSAVSGSFVVTGDTTAPATLSAALATDSGTGGDNITNVATINVTGVEAGALVQYQVDGMGAWTTVVGSTFNATAGAHTYNLQQTDAAGNVSAMFTSPSINFDAVAPTLASALIIYNDNGTAGLFSDDVWTVQMSEGFTIANAGLIQLYNETQGNFGTFNATVVGNNLVLTSTGLQPGNWTAGDTIDIAIGAGAIVDVAGNSNISIDLAGNFNAEALV